jgi:glutathione S-transferase
MAQPIVYGPTYSTYTRSVRLALEEKGVAYQLIDVDIIKGGGQDPKHLARQPWGKVPAFEHDGLSLYETAAITRYVDEAFAGPRLQPEGVRERARMNQMICILDSYVNGPLVQKLVIQRLVVPMLGGATDEAVVREALPQVEKGCGELARLMGGNAFLGGPAITLADIQAIPMFAYLSMCPEGAGVFAASPSMKAWWDRMAARTTVQKTAPKFG